MTEIVKCSSNDYSLLVEIWECSVRATHDFLSEEDLCAIKEELIPCYFPAVELYAVTGNGAHKGFIGLNADMIEMLFIDSDSRGLGYGSFLLDFAIQKGASKVDVNEQNPSALNFYKRKGFRIIGRDKTDSAGRPYPILHLSL